MPLIIKKKGQAWQVVDSETGNVAGWHKSKDGAKDHLRSVAPVDDSTKSFNPAEHRVPPGGPGAGRFSQGQVSDRSKPGGSGRGGQGEQGGGGGGGQLPRNAFIPVHHEGNPGHHEDQVRMAARENLAQAREIEAQIKMLREQLRWDREQIAFLSGVGPEPTTPSPRGPQTQGAAGHVGSAPVAGATSGAVAQRFSNTPDNPHDEAYVQSLHHDVSAIRQQIQQMDTQAESLHDHANVILDTIRGKNHPAPEITLTAGALRSLINSYHNKRDVSQR